MRFGGVVTEWLPLLLSALCAIGHSSSADLFLDDGAAHVLTTVVNGNLYVDYEAPPSTGTSVTIVENGEVMDTIQAYGTSVVTVDGGGVWGGQFISAIEAFDQSHFDILAGTIEDTIVGLNDSVFNISGGNLNADLVIAAGEVGSYDRSSFTFTGTGFELDGEVVPYGVYDAGEDNFREGTVSGILEDGTAFSVNYTMYDGGSIALVPEMSAHPLLISAVAFFAIFFRGRKKALPE